MLNSCAQMFKNIFFLKKKRSTFCLWANRNTIFEFVFLGAEFGSGAPRAVQKHAYSRTPRTIVRTSPELIRASGS